MGNHALITGSNMHVAHAFEYSDAAARLAAIGFASTDIGKVALQLDNFSFWLLSDDSPITWQRIGRYALGCRISKSANQSIPNSTHTAVIFNQETRDDGGWHDNSTNNTRLTCPAGEDGWFTISANVKWAGSSSLLRWVRIMLNGTTELASDIRNSLSTGDSLRQSLTTSFYLTAGDYVEVTVWQNITGGGSLNVESGNETSFSIKQ